MASNETVLKIRAEIDNLQGLNQLKTALRKSSAEAKGADNDFKALVQKVRELQSASVKSINNLNAQRDAFEALRRSADVTSKEFKEAREEIEKIDRALKQASGTVVKYSKNSINALRAQKNELLAVRDSADLMSKEFKEAGIELAKLDKKLAKAEGRKAGGGRLRAGAQIAGTIAGAGVFGGPEGAAGSALGGIAGGVPGAVVGGAIGAQVGQLRRQLGDFADYAASITRLKIALEGIAGTQGEYNRALAASASVTKELNVPQEVAIRGITRLTAAVKGAGGGVADAELAFKNISSAITATGGGAEEVQGAVTALVQIFSKGKVSAEEINQIAERLPGTFNKIAEASGRSGPELTKALQAGEVGLNDLMKFLVQLGGDYGELAKKIAGSSESAGARLTVAYNNMRIEIGKALQPVGAEFQQAFGEFLKEITPAILAALPSIRDGLIALAKNLDLVAQAAAAAFAVFVVGKIAAIIASIGSLSAAFFTLKLNAIVATKALVGMNAAALLNPYVALAAGAAALAIAIGRAASRQAALNALIRDGSVADVQSKISELQTREAEIEKTAYSGKTVSIKGDRQDTLGVALAKKELKENKESQRKLRARLTSAKNDRDQGADLPDSLLKNNLTNFASPTGTDTGGGGGGGGKGKAEKARQSRLDSIRDQGKLIVAAKMRAGIELDIGEAQNKNNRLRVSQLNSQKISLDFAEQSARVELEYSDALKAAAGDKNESGMVQEAFATRENANALLLIDYNKQLLQEKQQYRFESEAIAKASEDELFNLRDQLGLISNQERIDRFRQSRIDAGDPNAEQQTDLYRQTIDPTLVEGLTQNIAKMKKELDDLVNPINQVTSAATAIGTAFSDSFKSVIDGSATTQEALAGFFKNIASYFLDMAVQIIQKMITMYILNTVVGLLPGGGGGGGGGGDIFANIAGRGGLRMAKGGVFAQDKIVPYAKGGIVNKPTMFTYANGGAGRFGLMGEAGPEAIMPLSRGSNGKLGVQASGGVGNVVVNVDASGTKTEGDGPNAKQLGSLIGAAVQSELVKQQRPGGILAS